MPRKPPPRLPTPEEALALLEKAKTGTPAMKKVALGTVEVLKDADREADLARLNNPAAPREDAARKAESSRPAIASETLDLPRGDLARAERRALLGIAAPRKSMWPQLSQHDQRIAELQQRHGEVLAKLNQLRDRRQQAPDADAAAMAEWYADGRKGPKPVPTVRALDERVAEAEAEADGAQLAAERAMEQRASFIERNRDRLLAVARQQREHEFERLTVLLDEVERSRGALLELRQAEVYAAMYPHEAVATEPPQRAVCGGMARPVQDTLQIRPAPQLDHAQLVRLLRLDAGWCSSIAPAGMVEQARGDDPQRQAVWTNTQAGKDARRAETERVVQNYRREYGHEPDALQLAAYLRGDR